MKINEGVDTVIDRVVDTKKHVFDVDDVAAVKSSLIHCSASSSWDLVHAVILDVIEALMAWE